MSHQILLNPGLFTFSACGLRSSVVSVLIRLTSDIGTLCRCMLTSDFLAGGLAESACTLTFPPTPGIAHKPGVGHAPGIALQPGVHTKTHLALYLSTSNILYTSHVFWGNTLHAIP